MRSPPRDHASSVILALGPTNTGKTHRAVTRMLEHATGMIGLPLRLLAREVYDRVVRAVGESEVALVTGEEKRVPRAPRYWICTVEAMPLDRPVDFLAVDEIQLAAHRERGHVFTERLLHARGVLETWFLGSDTMAPILRELLPGARLERQARLSSLRHAGRSGLSGLPLRSVVVAFSAAEVYELAARVRAKKGGVAVVLGALSPRTRNAQVALYEAREVNYLVATDAIGMGLNLDVDHVAFAATEKFDGREHRPLEAAELGQIAGRAGRHLRDGTFGTLNPLPELPPRLVARLEEHRFAPVKRLVWRNASLAFGSVDGLVASLGVLAPSPLYARVEQADDYDVLRMLAQRPRVLERAHGEAAVRSLWDVCQVPDYRKLLLNDHAALLEQLFVMLVDHGRLDPAWVAAEVNRVDRVDGEIDELTARLAAIRVWTYVGHQRAWIEAGLEERMREVEDRLGDALHERLVERFVERIARPRVTVRASTPTPKGAFFEQIGGILEDIRRTEARELGLWVEHVASAAHAEFELDDAGVVRHEGVVVGALVAGRELHAPGARQSVEAAIDPHARKRIERRLATFARDTVATLLEPIRAGAAEGLVRGIAWQLERGLGTIDVAQARNEIAALGAEHRPELEARGIVVGERTVFVRALLGGSAMRIRTLLVRLHAGENAPPPFPRGATSVGRAKGALPASYVALGFLPLGPRAIRVDVVERVLARLRVLESPFELPQEVRAWLATKRTELPRLMSALGFRPSGERWVIAVARD